MSDPTPPDSGSGLPSPSEAPGPGTDDRYAVPEFVLRRPRTLYSDALTADSLPSVALPGEPSPETTPESDPTPLPPDEPPSDGTPADTAPPAETAPRTDAEMNRKFLASLGLTVASAVLPGSGLLRGRQSQPTKTFGAVLTLGFLCVVSFLLLHVIPHWQSYAGRLISPVFLRTLLVVSLVVGLVWVVTIMATNLTTRPRGLRTAQRTTAAVLVGVLSLAVAVPSALAARYSFDTMKALRIFNKADDITSSSRPSIDANAQDPWEDHPRLNVLLLGSDNDESRNYNANGIGVRTDTIIVASINTATGATTLIQIPRNMPYAPFPEGTALAETFPDGFMSDVSRDESHVNSLWSWSEENHELFGDATFPGAEGLKLGVEGITGLDIDYFVMIDIDGLQQLIDAMGGVTVNINQRLDIGGDTEGRQPTGELLPGPDQHLDGYHALWYARSRRNTNDYNRMARQSCLIGAIVDQANPVTLITRFEAIAAAGSDMVLTDVPAEMLRPLVDLALKVKDQPLNRLAFSNGNNGYHYDNPDFEAMQKAIESAINPPPPGSTPLPLPSPSPEVDPSASASPEASPTPDSGLADGTQDVSDACAYNPVEEE